MVIDPLMPLMCGLSLSANGDGSEEAAYPFAKGAYGFLKAGAVSVRDRNNLAENVIERLFFAGEATSATHYATTEGAIRSGKKAAVDILTYTN